MINEALKLIINEGDLTLALIAIIVLSIAACIMTCVKNAHRIADFLEFWDERQRQRFVQKIQANCPHQWMFMPLVPRDGIYDLETVTACMVCGLEGPTEMVAKHYPAQYAAFLAWYERK